MSYAPIYSKLHELEQRLAVVEASKAVSSVSATQPTTATTATTDFDISGIRKEIDDLLKEVSGFAFATKEELPDVSGFATLASLDALATKEELVAYAELSAKFDNLLNVVSHLNTKITEANEKIAELEARP